MQEEFKAQMKVKDGQVAEEKKKAAEKMRENQDSCNKRYFVE